MSKDSLHVVFGAGPLGMAVARELHSRGNRVRVISRKGQASVPRGVEVIRGNAADPSTGRELCAGAAVVYHCANPPYTRWPQEYPALQKGILEVAASCKARLIVGDNLYMYGPVDGPMTEDLPYNATGPNGRVRAQMASLLLDAHRRGDVRVAIARASDFYGPEVLLSQVGERVFGAAVAGKPAQVLGNADTPHSFTFIDDFAKGMVILGENDRALGQVWHMPSGVTRTTRQFIGLIYEELGALPSVKTAPRAVISGLALFSPLMRALKEQMYQFENPFVVDSTKFVKAFGDISTAHGTAIRTTVEWYKARLASAGR